ncbi:MAG: hypothetical protein JNL40_06350 [Cyclobacteriaceae bacterium]|nr:hypothetical protein [Cyclobacteriaceae bacterium]
MEVTTMIIKFARCLAAFTIVSVCHGQSNIPPSPEKNYVRTERVLVGGITQEYQISTLPLTQKGTSYQYLDGIGRKLQEVNVKGSPMLADIIVPHAYDNTGREPIVYLPYASLPEAGGKFRSTAINAQRNFYAEPPRGVAASTIGPYTQYTFEQSPLDRVVETAKPRDDSWNSVPRKSTTYVKLNGANEVPLWKDLTSGLPQRSGFHAANTLRVKETTDEEGKIEKIYTNFRDQVVMSRVGNASGWFDTHYIYAPSGLLMKVLQPEGAARLATEFDGVTDAEKKSFMDRWMFQYQYDIEQRQVARRIPGNAEDSVGWQYTVYDRWNRVVLTQDPDQRIRNEYSFVKYDRFNRPILTGLYITNASLSSLRTSAAASVARFESEQNNSTGYTLSATFPTTISESDLTTVTYYDSYAFLSYTGWDAESNNYSFSALEGYPQGSELQTSVKGQPTGSKIRILGTTTWLNSVTHYDKNYRPVQVISENHLGGTLRTTTLFDFVGNTLKEQLYNTHANLTIQSRYLYDHAGRLTTIYHQVNSQPEILMASYKYNEVGQLTEKNIHSVDYGSTYLQSVDFRYNIKGWMTHINNASFTTDWANDDTNDKFGMELQYYVPTPMNVGTAGDIIQQKNLFDGNISAIKWKMDNQQDTPEERAYVFDYDILSRLRRAHYARNTQTWSNPSWTGDSGMFDEVISGYDKNGNIKVTDGAGNPDVAVTRYGKIQNSKGIVDQLKFGYQLNGKHSNRLIDLDDGGSNALGFTPASASITEEYQYSKSGNPTYDHNKSISNILYNHLNLVKEVQFTRPSGQIDKIEYTYDALGNKLSTMVKKNNVSVWRTDYVGEMQYDNGTLSFFSTKEGRVVRNGTSYDYEYFHKDHLGNVRMVYGLLKETLTYRASMENPAGNPAVAQKEEAAFRNISNTRYTDPSYNYTPSSEAVIGPDKSARVNGYTGYSPVGPAKVLAVSTGDKVYMETYARYSQVTGSSTVIAGTALLSAFTSPFGIISSGETATLYQSFSTSLPGVSAGMGTSSTVPKAYLVWLFFNSSNQFVNAGGQAITTAAYNDFEKLSRSFTATQNGYLYVYVANESSGNAGSSVYFDETYLVHEKNNLALQVLQATDYYPFGLSFNQYQSDRLKETSAGNYSPELRNRYLLQSQEFQKDLDLKFYQFQWRMYDPAVGRFAAIDPKATEMQPWSAYTFNYDSPLRFIDPDGQKPTPAEAARMSLHVYGESSDDILIGGWRVSQRQFGNLNDDTGLKSVVYERVVNGKVTEYTYATAGTEKNLKDVKADVTQPLGLSEQYRSAATHAKRISDLLGDIELSFTGHSLGGGEAALNALLTGRYAITFNAAGVSLLTKYQEGSWITPFKSESKIDAYIMLTDPLNLFQKNLALPSSNGNVHYLIPRSLSSIINGHSIENVLKNFDMKDSDWLIFHFK